MRSARRPLQFLALLALAIFPVACGGASQASSGANVTLQVWSMGAEGDKLQSSALLTQFHTQNPNITVKVTPVSWGVAHDKLITSVAGRQTPDVSQLGTTWMGEFAKLNALDELPSSVNTGQFYGSALETAKVNGKLYGVPWYVDTRVLYYRKDLAAKAGITSPPQTWDDLMTLAQKLKAGGAKEGLHLSTNNWQEYVPFLWSNGGDIFANGKFTLDSPQAVEALTEYVNFFKQGLSKPAAATYDVTKPFETGDVGSFFSGPWHMGLLTADGLDATKWGVVTVPKKVTGTSFVGGADLVVFKNSPNRDAAWKFVQFMSSQSTQVSWYGAVKDLPANKAAWTDSSMTADTNLQVFAQQLNDAKPPPAIAQWEEIASKVINTWLEKATLAKVTPEQAAAGMQKDATSTYQP